MTSRVSDCRDSLCWLLNSAKHVPYRPDSLFQTVTDVLGDHPCRSRLTKDVHDEPPIMAPGNDPKQD